MNLIDAYKLGVALRISLPRSLFKGARRLLSPLRHPQYLAIWLTPIGFVRYREFEYLFSSIKRFMPDPTHVLDIGSPKLVPITIAYTRPACHVTSIDLLDTDVQEVRDAIEHLALRNLDAQRQDARKLPYLNDTFDLITSVSVFEHIAPEKDGDMVAIRELSRVLRPGGIAIIIIPFAPKYFVEYCPQAVYDRPADPSGQTFYQRFYDLDKLQTNIIDPSALELTELAFIDERHPSKSPQRRYARSIAMNHRHTITYGLLYPILAKFLLSAPRPLKRCRKAYIACLTLTKRKV